VGNRSDDAKPELGFGVTDPALAGLESRNGHRYSQSVIQARIVRAYAGRDKGQSFRRGTKPNICVTLVPA
jgi:hypothetical protein